MVSRKRKHTGQVFISYRHIKPDEDLADELAAYLAEQGLGVFQDKQLRVGMDWVKEIEGQLRASKFFVVFLSAQSILSDMVCQEVEIAYELRRQGRMVILPVRVDFEDALPYHLAAYLTKIQYTLWRPGELVEDLCSQIYAVIAGNQKIYSREIKSSSAKTLDAAPLPAADLRIIMETGALPLDSPFYVRRREDALVESALQEKGSIIIVKGPRQSGKSSLMVRGYGFAEDKGMRVVYVDFQALDSDSLESLESIFKTLATLIDRKLGLNIFPTSVWDSGLGAKTSFAAFLGEVLNYSDSPLVLLLDEVDRIFACSFKDGFFAAVRSWHNRRATESCWKRLHLILGHSTDPALWIDDLYESPFNVGEKLRLLDFDRAQIADLNRRYGSPLGSSEEVDGLLDLLGGHPYLVRRALYTLATERWSFSSLVEVAARDDGPFGDHLRRYLWILHRNSSLKSAVSRVLHHGRCDNEAVYQRLAAAGLIVGEERSDVRMRCRLYYNYFIKHL